jgi:hypothetical protein
MGGKGGATGTGRDEEIADGGEDGDQPLQACRRSKAPHRPLASSQRQVRVLGSALSRELELAAGSQHDAVRVHAAVAVRHVRKASSRKTRSVRRDVRWRWTLKVFWTVA